MDREQIHKIRLNHLLTPNVGNTPKAGDNIHTTEADGSAGDHDHDHDHPSNLTIEEKKNITDLKLSGKSIEACSGCRGCNDDYVLTEVGDIHFGQIDDNPLLLIPPPKVET